MQTRRFGRTGHQSTIAIFGAFAISQGTQEQANSIMELVIESGLTISISRHPMAFQKSAYPPGWTPTETNSSWAAKLWNGTGKAR